MAHTDITITNSSGVLLPSQPSVPVVSGDTIAFSTDDGSSAVLFFSPGAVSVLSPPPSGPTTVTGSEGTTFTFISSDPGAYSVFFETSGNVTHPPFPVRETTRLLLEINSWRSFGGGGPTNSTNTAGVTGDTSD